MPNVIAVASQANRHHTAMTQVRHTLLHVMLLLSGLLVAPLLSGCLVAGVTSTGHFFLFPSLGVILVIVVLFALLRRR